MLNYVKFIKTTNISQTARFFLRPKWSQGNNSATISLRFLKNCNKTASLSDILKNAQKDTKEYTEIIEKFRKINLMPQTPETFNFSPGWTK